MAESDLTIGYSDLAKEIGYFIGYQSKAFASYDATQQAEIDAIIAAGYRRYLYPTFQDADGRTVPHEWSFLRPIAELTVAIGTQSYDLPDTFASLDGDMTFTSITDCKYYSIRSISDPQMRMLYQQNPNIGTQSPLYYCITPKTFNPTVGQRWSMQIYPPPDRAYVFKYRFVVQPNRPTVTNLYVPGGPQHSEMLKEACLAVAEQRMNDGLGMHTQLFGKMLMDSIAIDKNTNLGTHFGRNRDRSDGWSDRYGRGWGPYWNRDNGPVTYDGISPV